MDVESAKRAAWNDTHALIDDAVAYYGPAPIGRLDGRDALFAQVFDPIDRALRGARTETYVFLGGVWQEQVWVAATGDVTGDMVEPLFGVPAARGAVRLRFGVFHRFERDRIVEIRMLIDLVGLAAQSGFELLPPFPARRAHPPPPQLGNGCVTGLQDSAETAVTLRLVEDMLSGCNRLEGSDLESMGMAQYWHDDMRWYGPWGVGTTHGFDEFQRNAQGPSVASFPNRRGGFHQARIADGVTAAFTGWPSLQGTFEGEAFRGIEPTGASIGQNIMDFYVRRGDRLHENWVLIDLIDFAAQCGVDLLARLPEGAT